MIYLLFNFLRDNHNKLTIPLCFVIAALSILLQSQLNLEVDMGIVIDISRRIIDGQHLYSDILEVNPPAIFYLELPVVFLADHFHCTDTFAAGFYHTLLAILSLACCFWLLHMSADRRPPLLDHLIMISLCFSLLLLPLFMLHDQFGQREHVFMMLTLPYFISIYCWPIGKTPYSLPLKITIGLLAGTGFIIKPFFILAFATSELMRMIHSRRISVIFSAETVISALVIASFLVILVLMFPVYIHTTLPLISHTYFFFHDPHYTVVHWAIFTLLLLTGGGIMFVPCIGFYDKTAQQRSLLALMIGMIVIGLMQMKGWTYHFYPAMVIYFLYLPGVICLLDKDRSDIPSAIIPHIKNLVTCLILSLVTIYPLQIYPLFAQSNAVTERALNISRLLDKSKPATRLYCFCTTTWAYPVINLNHYRNVSHFQHLWLLSALENALDYYHDQPQKQHEYNVLKERFIHEVVTDFIATKPEIMMKERDQGYKWGKQEDIFAYMSADPRFAAELAHYTLKGEVAVPSNMLTIYQRK